MLAACKTNVSLRRSAQIQPRTIPAKTARFCQHFRWENALFAAKNACMLLFENASFNAKILFLRAFFVSNTHFLSCKMQFRPSDGVRSLCCNHAPGGWAHPLVRLVPVRLTVGARARNSGHERQIRLVDALSAVEPGAHRGFKTFNIRMSTLEICASNKWAELSSTKIIKKKRDFEKLLLPSVA